MRRFILSIVCVLSAFASVYSSSIVPSGTLPVLYVTTDGHASITSKETYVAGTYYMVGCDTVADVGSSSAQLPMQIRGRGNWTWTGFDKKPYRLKLDTKQGFGGMAKSRHWALLACADDNLAFLRTVVGFFLSRQLDLEWTPDIMPVELVINDDYKGLYFLTETVRVDKNRVAVTEQSNSCTDPDSVTGGWLVEIDNYADEGVLTRQDRGATYWISPHTPEILSTEQLGYLSAQWDAITAALYSGEAYKWERLLDLDQAARYYLVRELMNDKEGYHGSCYLHKDIGTDEKWKFGPLWDFGNAFFNDYHSFIFENPPYAPQVWIGQLYSYKEFQQRVKELWYTYLNQVDPQLSSFIDDYISSISAAAKLDVRRWKGTQNYQDNSDLQKRASRFREKYAEHMSWLRDKKQWGEGIRPTSIETPYSPADSPQKIVHNGRIVILRNGVRYDITGTRL